MHLNRTVGRIGFSGQSVLHCIYSKENDDLPLSAMHLLFHTVLTRHTHFPTFFWFLFVCRFYLLVGLLTCLAVFFRHVLLPVVKVGAKFWHCALLCIWLLKEKERLRCTQCESSNEIDPQAVLVLLRRECVFYAHCVS